MISSIVEFFNPQKWAHVKTVEHGCRITSGGSNERDATVYVQLYESSKGARKYTLSVSERDIDPKKLSEYFLTTDTYNKRICRWLAGRVDPDIPTYDKIGEEDVANMLKGKI